MSRQPGDAKPGAGDYLGSADTLISPDPSPRTADRTVDDDLAGQRLGVRYELLQPLGSGGMGAVYLARDYELDELIAIKVLHSAVAASSDAIELLRQEVRLARRVTHYNVARIFELGEHEGRRFLTMEYIDGESLAALMQREGRLSVSRTVDILAAVARGLQAAHDANIIHRDVKPDNVLVAHHGRVVISDFGIARAARDGRLLESGAVPAGTPAYMAPEHLTNRGVSTRSDVYSLGVMAFEMLTGELPWGSLEHDRFAQPPPDPRQIVPDLPDAVARVILDALALRPDDRLDSPITLARQLSAAMTARSHSRSGRRFTPSPAIALTSPPAPAVASKTTVCVLPFQNRGDGGDAYLACGFTEDLIDCLSAIGELRVLSRGATARFADDPREAHEIGRELGVEVVIEGSLQHTGDVVQVKARAIDAADGVQIWAQRYRVAPEDLLTTSDQVSRALASSLESCCEPQDPSPRHSAMPSAAAMETYLRAKAAYRQFESPHQVLSLFEEALRPAPDNPLVNAGHAMALLRALMLNVDDAPTLLPRAREAAQRAIASAPHLGEPHMALGLLHLHQGEPIDAVREFRATVSLAPSMPEAHAFLGELLAEMARVPEAILRLDTAARLDPSLTHPNGPRRRMAALLKDWDRAYALSQRAPPAKTALGWLLTTRIAAYRGDKEYLARIAEIVGDLPDDPFGMKQWVAAQLAVYRGLKPAVEAYPLLHPTSHARTMSRRRLANQYQILAEVAGFGGDGDAALDAIDHAVQVGLIDLLWLDHCPFLDDLRSEARFTELREQLLERAHAAYDAFWS